MFHKLQHINFHELHRLQELNTANWLLLSSQYLTVILQISDNWVYAIKIISAE